MTRAMVGAVPARKCPYRLLHPLLRDSQSQAGGKSRTAVLKHCPDRLMLQLGRYAGGDK